MGIFSFGAARFATVIKSRFVRRLMIIDGKNRTKQTDKPQIRHSKSKVNEEL